MILNTKNVSKEKEIELDILTNILVDNLSPEMVILFGSYARGDWVSDSYREGDITYEYESDFDVMVIVLSEKIKNDLGLKHRVLDLIEKQIRTPVNLIIETLHNVNEKLLEGNYFYLDIQREGVLLYDNGNNKLMEPTEVERSKRKSLSAKEFEFWTQSAEAFLKDYKHNIDDSEYNNAAFHLSQATESLYFCVLLVFTNYKPKSHNLEKILNLAEEISPELKGILSSENETDKRRFELLKKAYIEARYSKDYKIDPEDLQQLYERVLLLKSKVEKVCKKKLDEL